MNEVVFKLQEIFKILSINIDLKELPLQILSEQKSPLKNQFIEINLLEKLINKLSDQKSIIRLNHIGFCYKVKSKDKERERLKQEISKTNLNLYEMQSYDEALWLFAGDNKNWQDPMIEYLPIEKTKDKWVNYWLPHVHIDMDTTLSHQELEEMINNVFQKKIKPFRSVVIDNVVYCIRARLGIISGMNIMLDLTTKERDVEYSRKHLLKPL